MRTVLPHEMQMVQSFFVAFTGNADDNILTGHSHFNNCFASAMTNMFNSLCCL